MGHQDSAGQTFRGLEFRLVLTPFCKCQKLTYEVSLHQHILLRPCKAPPGMACRSPYVCHPHCPLRSPAPPGLRTKMRHLRNCTDSPSLYPGLSLKQNHIHPKTYWFPMRRNIKAWEAIISGPRNHRRQDPQFMVAEMTPRDTFSFLLAEVHSVGPRVQLRRLPCLREDACCRHAIPFQAGEACLGCGHFTL